MRDRSDHVGIALVLGATVAFSTAGFFTRLVPVDTWTTLFWRGWFAAAFLAAAILLRHRSRSLRVVRDVGLRGLLIAAASAGGMICFVAALKHTSVADVAIIWATAPMATALLAWAWLGERPGGGTLLAALAAAGGVVVMVMAAGPQSETTILGKVLAFAMTLCLAVMMILLRQGGKVDMIPASCLSAVIAALVSLPFAQVGGLPWSDLAGLAAFGVTQMGLGLFLFTLGSPRVPPAENALIGTLDTPLAILWVGFAFAEWPSPATLLGGAVVAAAVLWHLKIEFGAHPSGDEASKTAAVLPGAAGER